MAKALIKRFVETGGRVGIGKLILPLASLLFSNQYDIYLQLILTLTPQSSNISLQS